MAGLEGAAFGLSAAGAFGVSDVGGTVASRRLGSTQTTALVVPISALMLISTFILTGDRLPTEPRVLLLCSLSGAFGTVAYFAAYAALRAGPISVVIPIMFAYGGLAVLFSIVFLGEQPSPSNIIAAGVATVGVALLGVTHLGGTRLRLSGKGVGFALIVLVAVAANAISSTLAVRETEWLGALTVARSTNATIVVAVVAALAIWRRRQASSPEGQAAVSQIAALRTAGIGTVGLVVAIAALELVAVSSLFLGFKVGPTWLVALTSSFSPLIGIVAGLTVFKERPSQLQWAGLALVLVSAGLLALRP